MRKTKELIFVSAGDSLSEAFALAESRMRESRKGLDITVELSAGEHVLREPAVFRGVSEKHSLTLRGAGRDTVISSLVTVPSAELVPLGDGIYRYTLPDGYRVEDRYPALRDLYKNGRILPVARTRGEHIFDRDAVKYADPEKRVFVDPEDRVLYVDESLVEGLSPDGLSGAELWIKVEWEVYAVHIESILFDRKSTHKVTGEPLVALRIRDRDWLHLTGDATLERCNYYSTLETRGYWIENHISCLTENDSFTYDRQSGSFFVKLSDEDAKNAVLSFPVLSNLVKFFDASNLTVTALSMTGITNPYIDEYGYITGQCGFQKGVNAHMNPFVNDEDYRATMYEYDLSEERSAGFLPYAALYGVNLSGVTVKDCDFFDISVDAVSFRGALSDITVSDNRFTYMGGSAIRIGNSSRTFNEEFHNRNITVTENEIEKTGMVYTSNVAIYISPVQDLSLTHNTVRDATYSAISVGWEWGKNDGTHTNVRNAEIAYNYVDGFMMGMKDGGAIYVVGGNGSEAEPGYFNEIHDNVCAVKAKTGYLGGRWTGGWTVLYHDGSSSHWYTHNNIVLTRHGDYTREHRFDLSRYNIVDENPTIFSYISLQTVKGQQTYHNRVTDNYIVGIEEEHWILGGGHKPEFDQFVEHNHAVRDLPTLLREHPKSARIFARCGITRKK